MTCASCSEKIPAVRPRWKKYLCRALASLALTAVVLAVLLLGAKRPRSVPDFPDMEESLRIGVIAGKLWNAVGVGMRNKLPQVTVELAPEEINALLNLAIRHWQFRHGASDDPVLGAVWRSGAAEITVSLPLTGSLAVNVACRAVPHLADRRLTITTGNDYAGWLPLPAAVVNAQVRDALKQAETHPHYQSALEILQEIKVLENGGLAVTFDPSRAGYLMQLLRNR